MLSAKNGEIEKLKDLMFSIGVGTELSSDADYLTEERHFDAINRALKSINNAKANQGAPLDLIAYDIKECWDILGEITGETASESIIDEIFKKFCVGK